MPGGAGKSSGGRLRRTEALRSWALGFTHALPGGRFKDLDGDSEKWMEQLCKGVLEALHARAGRVIAKDSKSAFAVWHSGAPSVSPVGPTEHVCQQAIVRLPGCMLAGAPARVAIMTWASMHRDATPSVPVDDRVCKRMRLLSRGKCPCLFDPSAVACRAATTG